MCLIGIEAKLQDSDLPGTGLDIPELTALPVLQLLLVLVAWINGLASCWIHGDYNIRHKYPTTSIGGKSPILRLHCVALYAGRHFLLTFRSLLRPMIAVDVKDRDRK